VNRIPGFGRRASLEIFGLAPPIAKGWAQPPSGKPLRGTMHVGEMGGSGLPADQVAEIEMRFATLKPCLAAA
jgi:hypothetical protein